MEEKLWESYICLVKEMTVEVSQEGSMVIERNGSGPQMSLSKRHCHVWSR